MMVTRYEFPQKMCAPMLTKLVLLQTALLRFELRERGAYVCVCGGGEPGLGHMLLVVNTY